MSLINLSTSTVTTTFRPRIDLEVLNRPNSNQKSGVSTDKNSIDTDNSKSKADTLENNVNSTIEKRAEKIDKSALAALERRDREVRSHEQAHKAVAGRFASGATFTLERGPDGRFFAVGGHVNLDVSEESTPEKTIQKMMIIRRAALAPAKPSAQDRAVASQATASEAEAKRELAREKAEETDEMSSANRNERPDSIKIEQNSGIGNVAGGVEFSKSEGSLIDTFA
ncbi:MAG: putative metalloprotease CJM1_0395 family protein [Candidatus Anammoxibacter sp.]